MTNTTNYNLLLAEGTDLVNYLTQTNPNFSSLDTIIKGVSDATVTAATEVTTGTAHAISRSLPDANVIRFTATSNWLTGDTMTIDGTPVTPLKTDGTTLKTGDYIIGAAVLGILDATRFTVLVASSPDAIDINYDNSGSGLTANKVQGAIDENAADIDALETTVNTFTGNTTFGSTTTYSDADLPITLQHDAIVTLRHEAASAANTTVTLAVNSSTIMSIRKWDTYSYAITNCTYLPKGAIVEHITAQTGAVGNVSIRYINNR